MRRAYIYLTLAALTFSFIMAPKAAAAGIDWQAGNIISDSTFSNKSSMSAALIQQFLESKVPSCDTNGLQNSEFGGPDLNGDGKVQRWEYGKAYYNQTSFPCLKDYRVEDGRLASQVIYDIAQKYSINPQVFLVLLQKEQGLVTDTWPLSIQYRSAAGYGCPDTSVCNSQYYGLVNQLDWAGKMYRAILNDSPTWYTPYLVGSNFIAYNPNRDACGGSTVNISNRATQALYNYTPYQPNQGALDAGWGTAYCGAYGNLRFYQYFTNWFGSTRGGDSFSYDLVMDTPITISPANPRAGETTTVSFTVRNASSNTITYGSNLLQCRVGLYINCDSSVKSGGSIPSGGTQSFNYTVVIPTSGIVTIKPFFLNNGVWFRFSPSSTSASDKSFDTPQLRSTSPMSYSPQYPNVGETMKFSVPIINNGIDPITISTSLVQCRINGVINCDTPPGGTDTIPPGATRVYEYAIPITVAGSYTFTPYYLYNGVWYKYIYQDNPVTVISTDITAENTLSTNNSSPIPGEQFSVGYSLTNNSQNPVTLDSLVTQCRYNTAVNCDSSYRQSTSLSSNQTVAFSDSFMSDSIGSYRFLPYYSIGGEYHVPRLTSALEVKITSYIADMRITNFEVNTPSIGEALTASYTVKNYGPKTAYYQDGVLQCRLNKVVNCDSTYIGKIEIPSGDSKTFTTELSSQAISGTYVLTPYFMQEGKWLQYKNMGGAPLSSTTISVDYVEPNLAISSPISLSANPPTVGSSVIAQYTIKNNGSSTIHLSKWVTQCRINGLINCDNPSGTMGPSFAINSGQSITLQSTHQVTNAGSYKLVPYFSYNSQWYTYSGTGSSVSFTAH